MSKIVKLKSNKSYVLKGLRRCLDSIVVKTVYEFRGSSECIEEAVQHLKSDPYVSCVSVNGNTLKFNAWPRR